jgi:hypothetical protein
MSARHRGQAPAGGFGDVLTGTRHATVHALIPNGYPGDQDPFTAEAAASLVGQTPHLLRRPAEPSSTLGQATITDAHLDADGNIDVTVRMPDGARQLLGDKLQHLSMGYRRSPDAADRREVLQLWPWPASAAEFTAPRRRLSGRTRTPNPVSVRCQPDPRLDPWLLTCTGNHAGSAWTARYRTWDEAILAVPDHLRQYHQGPAWVDKSLLTAPEERARGPRWPRLRRGSR